MSWTLYPMTGGEIIESPIAFTDEIICHGRLRVSEIQDTPHSGDELRALVGGWANVSMLATVFAKRHLELPSWWNLPARLDAKLKAKLDADELAAAFNRMYELDG